MHFWYRVQKPPVYLRPFSMLFTGIIQLRRRLYQKGWLASSHFPVPVIVVGNITVGGTGKTPFVIWLVRFLRAQGYCPGVVSRGYGGKFDGQPCIVESHANPALIGDEPLLIAQRALCPVVVGHQRVKAVQKLLQHTPCDIVISDDGLQHYALGRTMEIALLDADRGTGNGYCLPAGPLREPVSRLREVDFVVEKVLEGGLGGIYPQWAFTLTPETCVSLTRPSHVQPLSYFKGKRVHAVAGIAHPASFFQLLTQAGIEVVSHALPDHHALSARDFTFEEDLPILMTEKDAVKVKGWARENMWAVPVSAAVPETLSAVILEKLKQRQ